MQITVVTVDKIKEKYLTVEQVEWSGKVKKRFCFLVAYIVLVISLSPANIIYAADTDNSGIFAENKVISYPSGYDISSQGASSYNGVSNVRNSAYYSNLDLFNMKSTDTLTILSKYKTYQQTTEVTCGPAAALTVLYYSGDTNWDELKIAKIMGTKQGTGTDTSGMVKFFKTIGWDVKSSLTTAKKDGKTFASVKDFKDFVISNLKNNTPIMVENIDWSGHWRVIIGYDNMGTETIADDVLILADSYDTADHSQDGYVVNPVEKFYYMWFDSHMLPKGQKTQQWLTVKSPK